MIWLRALLPLAAAYLYRPDLWHACAWGSINPSPIPAIFIVLCAMAIASWVALNQNYGDNYV